MKTLFAAINLLAILACFALVAQETPIVRNESSSTPLARLVFKKDYFPGTYDANGNFMGGTEALWLA